ncbi:E3 SUMO-protein ligase ZBED1-like [Xyrauchen texanus]|uniref:E3 SUMO-protein ligase ZBED1-like n=1 Tax=Xyrauchen texanus TaxID=154827 RepID=UPI0022425898|nr:E3 SUMO-protein ligase ZBED1-like [Xyrauchen texanus]
MDPFLQKNQTCTPQQANALSESVLQMLIYDVRPLSMVDGAGFQQMIAQFNPDYILPSRTHFTHLMEQKYSTTFLKVKQILKEVNSSITLTSDVWTSRATEAYLGVSCHFITKDWQMKTLNLATLPLEERHTAANIMIWMEEVIEKFDILPSKIKAIVHDNGSNMVAAARLLEEKHGWSSVRCAGHTHHLIINSALKEPSINKATGAARNLVEHFRRSELANSKLKKKQQQMYTTEHKLIQDVSTRWNSTYYMVSRLLEQRWPVTATLSDPEVTPRGKHYFDLKPEQWVLLEELVQGLGPFECATVFLSGQEYATASCLPKLVKGLQRSIQQTQFETSSGKAFQTIAGKGISERWENLNTVSAERDNPLVLAAAIDPRFRKLKFISLEDGTRVQSTVEVLAIKEAKAKTGLHDDPEELQQKKRGHIPGGKSALDNLLQSDTDSLSEEEEETQEDKKIQMVRREVQMFFTEPPIAKKEDPLSWWSENEGRFPTLSNLARSLLCIPATSTPAERIFSAAGNICSQKRASLTRDHVDMLTFLNMNKLNDIA